MYTQIFIRGFIGLLLVVTFVIPTVSFADNSALSAEEQAQHIAAELNYDETKIAAKIEELKAMLEEIQAKVKEAKKASPGKSDGYVSPSMKAVAPTLAVSAKVDMVVNVLDPAQKAMADATKDGVIDNADLSLVFASGLGTTCEGCAADINKDGVVSVQDVVMVSLFWTGLYKK